MDPLKFTIAIGITNSIVLAVNRIFPKARKFSPLWALQVGIMSYCLLAGFTPENAAYGLVVALSAVGVWSSGKNVTQGVVDLAS